jgi:extracellular elastinolytic metalloproteinase
VRDYTDVAGVRHLVFAQTSRGIAAFDNDLRASVTSDGRLVNVLGSPLPDLEAPATSPPLEAGAAVGAAFREVGRVARSPRVVARGHGARQSTTFAGGHRANLVLFNGEDGVRLAWRVTAHTDTDEVYDSLVDASSGEVVRQANKVEDVTGRAWEYYPGAAVGGTATEVDFTARGWLPAAATTLSGDYARVFLDLDDDDQADSGEEAGPGPGGNWDHAFTQFAHEEGFCAPAGGVSHCSWNSYQQGTWATNQLQNATQVFYFLNNFHDHLKNDPGIGFDADSGNFEGADHVVAHANDGADIGTPDTFLGEHMPDDDHVNNANMLTLPDGQKPRMQMFLFTSFTGDFSTDPAPDVNGGDDAAVVYHEYVHGLSNRLITYANGWGALDAFQSGSMGEAWSDWYALDYLVERGFASDDPATDGEVLLDRYVGNGQHTLRSQALDCTAQVDSPACPDGGHTYGDMGTICFCGPQVHADGEIWAQTLWDLRESVGVSDARFLVTEAMRLSPANPSFLDMRNAILEANQVNMLPPRSRPDLESQIWAVFAARGMGFFAATSGANDTAPGEDFQLPPDASAGAGAISGVVRDPENGNTPVAGARVEIPSNPAGLSDVTDSLGRYSIDGVPAGTYPLVAAAKNAYDRATATDVPVVDGTVTALDFDLRRNWASLAGGGRIWRFTGPNYSSFGCGPSQAIDQSLVAGWGSETGAARSITVRLPSFVDVKAFAVDPGATCGDSADAGLRGYKVELSTNGASFSLLRSGSFGLADGGRLNLFTLGSARTAVRYIRLTMLSNHGNPDFVDMTELAVYGKSRPSCLGLPATRVGTVGANRITGTRRADVIVGLGGNDRVDGRGGADVICGGPGSDTLIGGPGVDKLDGASGNDTLYSRDGVVERTLRGGVGRDRVRKDPGDRTGSVERFF